MCRTALDPRLPRRYASNRSPELSPATTMHCAHWLSRRLSVEKPHGRGAACCVIMHNPRESKQASHCTPLPLQIHSLSHHHSKVVSRGHQFTRRHRHIRQGTSRCVEICPLRTPLDTVVPFRPLEKLSGIRTGLPVARLRSPCQTELVGA